MGDFNILGVFFIGVSAGIFTAITLQIIIEYSRVRNRRKTYDFINNKIERMFLDIEKSAKNTKKIDSEIGIECFSMHISQLGRLIITNADILKPEQREKLIDILFDEERRIIMAKRGKKPLTKNHYENLLYTFKEIKWLKIKRKTELDTGD